MSDLKDLQKDIDSAIYSAYQFGRVNDPKQNTPFTGDMAVQMVNEIVKSAPSLVSTSGGTPSIYGDSQMNLSFDRYYAHPSYSTLGFSPWRDNEGLYNDQSSWVDDLSRGLKTTGAIIGSTMWNNKPFLSTLDLFDPLNYEEEHANELSRLMKIGTSTRGGLGGFTTNFFVNSGITLGIVGSAIIENMAIGAISAGMASTGVGAAPGAATFTMGTAATVAKAGARFSKMMGTLKLLSNVGKNADDLKRVFDFSKQAQRLGTLADNAVVDFFNPMSNVFKLAKEAPETFKGLNALGKASQTFGAFYRDARNMAMVVNEAQLEGGLVINQMMEDFIRSEYDRTGEYPSLERTEAARNAAQEGAFYTTMINLPLIHFSNKVVLDNILNSSKSVSTILKEIEVGKVLGNFVKSPDGYKYLAPGFKNITHTLRPARMAGHLLNYSRKNFMEAIQENAQEATSAGVINYYSNILNNPYVDQSQLLRDSIHKGIGEQFTGQGLETFFSGFLTGGLIGGIGNILTFGADKYKQLYQKEKWDKYVTERDAYINEVENSLNFLDKNLLDLGTGFDDILSPTLVDAAQQSAVANGISRSTSENNVNVQKNLQDLALYEHVYNALRVGKFDEIMSSYKDLLSLNDQDLLNAFPDKGMTASEIRNKLNTTIQRGNRIKERFDKYASYENPISVANMDRSDPAYPKMVAKRNAIETVRKLLIMSEEDYTRGVERMSDITNSLMEVLPSIADANSDEILSFLDPDVKLNAVLLPRLKTELQTLQDTLKTGVLSAEDKALVDKKVDFLNKQVAAVVVLDAKLRNFRASFRNNKEFSKDEREELLKVYKNYIQVLGGKPGALGVITNDQALNKSLEYILDYIVLTEENKVLGAAINVMQDPKGFATTSNAVTDYFESILQNSAFMSSLYKRAIAMNEENALYNYIFNKHNLFVHPTEEELYFVDAITEKVIDETDPRYESAEKDYYEFREKVSSQEAQKEKASRAEVKLKRESFRKEAKDKFIDSILENYPQLTREQIQDALDSGTLDELLNVDSNVFALKEIMGVNPDSETTSISFLLEQNLIPEEAYAVLETIRDNMSYLYLTDDVISKLKEKIKSDPNNKAFYEEQINSIKSKLSELNLKSAYFNIATGKYYTRTTDYIKPGEKSPPSADSAKKGNAVDAYVRDFFANPENRNADKPGYPKLFQYLADFEEAAKARGEYIIPTGITLFDDVLGVAGTVDILTVDKDGKFRIYDVKTSDKDYLANTVGKDGVLEYDVIQKDGMSIRESHSRQLNTYRELLETYGDNVEVIGLQIIRVKRDKSSREGSRDAYRALSPVDITIGNVEDTTPTPGSKSEVVTETSAKEVTREEVITDATASSDKTNINSYEYKLSILNKNLNRLVTINGITGTLLKLNDNLFEIDTIDTVYEMSVDQMYDIQVYDENNIEIIEQNKINNKYNVKDVSETSVVVNDVLYTINVDSLGNIISLSPSNKEDQNIKNESLIVAVEIERNKLEFTSEVSNEDSLILNNLESNYANLNLLLESVYSYNFTETVASALDNLYNNKPLSESELLQLSLWLKDSFDRVVKLFDSKNTSEENEVLLKAYDNLDIINTLLYNTHNITVKKNERSKSRTRKTSKQRQEQSFEEVKADVATSKTEGEIKDQVKKKSSPSSEKKNKEKSFFNMISLFNGVLQRIRKGKIVAKVSYNPELGKFEYWNESGTEELNPRQQTIIAKHLFSKNTTYLFRFWYEYITSKNTEIRSRLNTLYEEYEVSKSENRLDGEVLFARDALLIRNALYGKLIVEDKDKSEFGPDNNLKRNSWFASQGVRGITIDQFVVDMMAEAYAQGDWYDLVGKKNELELTEYIKEVIRDSQGYTLKQLKDLANRTIDNTFDVEFLSQFGIPLSAIEKNKSLFWNQEPTSVNTAYEGKLVYGTPGSGKTYFVANNTDNDSIIDVDNLLLRQLRILDETYDFAKGLSFTNENLAELILKYGNVTGKKKEEDYDPELYDPVRKEINSLKAQGKILLTGTLRFILEADVVVVAEDRESKMRSKLSSDGNMSNERIGKYKERENERGAVIVLPAGKYIDYVLYRNPSELIDSEGIAKIQQAKIDSVKYDPSYAKSYFYIVSERENVALSLNVLNKSFNVDAYEAAQISEFYEKFIGKTLKSLSPEDQNLIIQPGVVLMHPREFNSNVYISEVSFEDGDLVIQTMYSIPPHGTRNFSSKAAFIEAYSGKKDKYTISFGTRPIEGGSGADVNTGNNNMPNTTTDDDSYPTCPPF